METRRPIILHATDGVDSYPIELTRWCQRCAGVGLIGSTGDVSTTCPECKGGATVPTANGLALRKFLSEQLS